MPTLTDIQPVTLISSLIKNDVGDWVGWIGLDGIRWIESDKMGWIGRDGLDKIIWIGLARRRRRKE
eukprot:7635472-Pyramimonas_sp.AAC.1